MFLPLLLLLLPACSQNAQQMHDGYYTAEVTSFDDQGWKPFLTIYVSNNKIVTVEYNAKNASGFIKSWDMDFMRRMKSAVGTYPNKYVRAYAAALLDKQNPAWVMPYPGLKVLSYYFRNFPLPPSARPGRATKVLRWLICPQAESQMNGSLFYICLWCSHPLKGGLIFEI